MTTRPFFEERQPQDLVTGVRDEQAVDQPRPRQTNRFVVTGAQVVLPSARGALAVTVDSAVGFDVGNTVQVMLDNGVPFVVALTGVTGNVLSWSSAFPLPYSVGGPLGDPLDNAVINISTLPSGAFVRQN